MSLHHCPWAEMFVLKHSQYRMTNIQLKDWKTQIYNLLNEDTFWKNLTLELIKFVIKPP